jgi:TonB-dependent receptor
MRIATLFLTMFMLATQAFAKGTITGKISDEKTGEPIIGATVVIQGTATGTATDVDGYFTLNTEAGDYVLEIKYIGYQQKNISEVAVKDGKVTTVNALVAEDDKTKLQEVVVTASLKKESINALYVLQKNSVAVSSGISADVIQRTPDRNTGEVLKRVSGASVQDGKYVVIRGLANRYNLAMVNNALMPSTEPDKKAFSFDVIPSNLIDNIIISKTATPDMPGDFAGGIVQVLTKDVPEKNFLNVGVTLGFNSQATFKDVTTNGISGGEYLGFGSDKKLPASYGADYKDYKALTPEKQTAANKELSNNYAEKQSTALPNMGVQASYGNAAYMKNGAKLGTVVGVSYRNGYSYIPEYIRANYQNDNSINSYNTDAQTKFSSNLAGLANFAYVKGKSKYSFKNLYNKILTNQYYNRKGYTVSTNQEIQMASSIPSERQVINTQLEGEHAIGDKNVKLNWNLNYSNFKSDQNDLRTAFYSRTVTFGADGQPVAENGSPYKIVDRNSRRFFSNQNDNSYGANLNMSYPFQMFDQKQTFKAGYMGLYKDRTFAARVFQYESYTGANVSDELAEMPVGEIFAPANLGPSGFRLNEITNPTDRYDATGLLNSGYLMLDNAFNSKWRLTWGVRFESYTQNLQGVDLSNKTIDKTDVFNDVLPSVNLSYSFNDKSKLRIGGSRTVNRPEFREIAPFQFLDFENLWTISGNPDLVRGNINNFDLRYEFYPNPGEAITVGAFYKKFENAIEAVMNSQSNLDLFIFGYQNAKSADAMGAEIDLRKNLSFLGTQKWMENLILGANLTYVYSKVDVSNLTGVASAERPLQGQSPYLINLSALYSDANSGLSFSALYNRVGHRINIVGNSTIRSTWENGRDVIDLQISKSVLKNRAEIKFTLGDLLNQATTLYWNTDSKNSYSKGTDVIFQQYKLGSTYTVGFNYKFGK